MMDLIFILMAKKLSFLPSMRLIRKHWAGKQNFTQLLPWALQPSPGSLPQLFEIPLSFCPNGLNDGIQSFLIGQWITIVYFHSLHFLQKKKKICLLLPCLVRLFCDVGLPSLTLKVRSNDNIEMVFQFSSSSSIHSTNLNCETVHLWGIWDNPYRPIQ